MVDDDLPIGTIGSEKILVGSSTFGVKKSALPLDSSLDEGMPTTPSVPSHFQLSTINDTATMASSDLTTRLQSMLRLNANQSDHSDASNKKPLIEVIDNDNDNDNGDCSDENVLPTNQNQNSNNDDDDDEEPPPLFPTASMMEATHASTAATNSTTNTATNIAAAETSLAEQMIRDANDALRRKKSEEDLKRQKRVNKVR